MHLNNVKKLIFAFDERICQKHFSCLSHKSRGQTIRIETSFLTIKLLNFNSEFLMPINTKEHVWVSKYWSNDYNCKLTTNNSESQQRTVSFSKLFFHACFSLVINYREQDHEGLLCCIIASHIPYDKQTDKRWKDTWIDEKETNERVYEKRKIRVKTREKVMRWEMWKENKVKVKSKL